MAMIAETINATANKMTDKAPITSNVADKNPSGVPATGTNIKAAPPINPPIYNKKRATLREIISSPLSSRMNQSPGSAVLKHRYASWTLKLIHAILCRELKEVWTRVLYF